MNRFKLANELTRIAKLITSEGALATTIPVVAKTMTPVALSKALKENGIEITQHGECKFYPLTGIGIPDWNKPPMVVKGQEEALRQCANVIEAVAEKQETYGALLNKLSRLKNFLKTAVQVGEVTEDDAENALFMYESDVEAVLPQRTPSSEYMKRLVSGLQDAKSSISVLEFEEAIEKIEDIQPLIAHAVAAWKIQEESWETRKQLLVAIRETFEEVGDQQ